jgi:predicted DNA binding protein
MSVIASVEMPAEEFALGAALTDPGVRIRLERVVPTGETFAPYFWVSDDSSERVERVLEADDDVDSVRVLDQLNGETLVRVEWRDPVDRVVEIAHETNARLLEAVGENGAWDVRLRFPDHANLTEFYRSCARDGVTIDLQGVYSPDVSKSVGLADGLTDVQRKTLRVALEAGYFDVPRETNLVELADRLGVSDTAVSQRIRRGVAKLLAEHVDAESPDDR